MTEAGDRLIEDAKEALAIATGEQPAARLHIDGHAYVPEETAKKAADEAHAVGFRDMRLNAQSLVDKARNLVELLDDAERNHGSLIGTKTLTAVNDLRLELAKWK